MGGGAKGGGGGGGNAPQAHTYTDPVDGYTYSDNYMSGGGGAEGLNQHIAQRKADEAVASQHATDVKNRDDTEARNAFLTKRQDAFTGAQEATNRAFQLQGADPNQYLSDINPALQRQYNSIQDLDPNPGAAFPTNLGETIVGNVLAGKRTGALNKLNETFTPNYSSTALPDSVLGQYTGQLVNEQFDPLMAQLTNAQKRHTLTDVGYNAALDALGQKKSAATSQVTDLGRGILAADRSGLDDYISGARTSANNLTLGGSFDPNSFISGATTRGQQDLDQFGGKLRSAVGGTKFADISELINAGGAVQGANNPNAANPAGARSGTSSAFVPEDVLAQRKRGLGNAGAF